MTGKCCMSMIFIFAVIDDREVPEYVTDVPRSRR